MDVSEIDLNLFARDNLWDGESLEIVPGGICKVWRSSRESRPAAKCSGPMKVIAINTSPDRGYGIISRLLDPLLEGMKAAGAEVELYYSRDLVIFPCCGNLNCTIRTPGNCMAYDDMRWLREKIGQADVLVLASPLYFNGLIGTEGATPSLRSLLGRLIPGGSSSEDEPYEHAVHTTRESVNLSKILFVSGCGFWEIEDFYPVLTHIKALCYNTFPEFAGNVNTAHGVLLRGALETGASEKEVLELARAAGRQLARGAKEPAVDAVHRVRQTRETYYRIMGKQTEIECR